MALTRDKQPHHARIRRIRRCYVNAREWRQGRAAALGDLAEETPRYAREPVEFPHWARLVLSQGHLNLIEPGDVPIAYVAAVIDPGRALPEAGVPQSECDPLKLLLDGRAPSRRRARGRADPTAARPRHTRYRVGRCFRDRSSFDGEGMVRSQGDDLGLEEQGHDLEEPRRDRQLDEADVHPAPQEIVDLIRRRRVNDGNVRPGEASANSRMTEVAARLA